MNSNQFTEQVNLGRPLGYDKHGPKWLQSSGNLEKIASALQPKA